MIAINLTFFIEMALFLLFFLLARRWVFLPVIQMMDRRADTVRRDESAREAAHRDTERMAQEYRVKLTDADQDAARRIERARYTGYRENRQLMEALKQQVDTEVDAYHEQMRRRVEAQRQEFPQLIPELVEAMDRQIKTGGTVF